MRVLASLASVTLALTSVAAFADAGTAASEATTASSEDAAKPAKKPRKICRSETATGSVMAKRVCYTPEQIKAQQKQTDQDLRNLKK